MRGLYQTVGSMAISSVEHTGDDQIDSPIVDCIDRNPGFIVLRADFKIDEVSGFQNRW